MTRLSVNINKIATLRNSRGGNLPNIIQFTIDCEKYGAQGITVHPRPDGRHIREDDVLGLRNVITTEYNIEGYPNDRFLEMVMSVVPDQVTLVPDTPHVLTSNMGWDTVQHEGFLSDTIKIFKRLKIRVSIFVDPNLKMIDGAKKCGADRIELYTEAYAKAYEKEKEKIIQPYFTAAKHAQDLKMGINAGHDLNLKNLKFLKENIPFIDEVSIGHALICDALYLGIENTIQLYRRSLDIL